MSFDPDPAATAEHERRRDAIAAWPYVMETGPDVFVAAFRVVARLPLGAGVEALLIANGYAPITNALDPIVHPTHGPVPHFGEPLRDALGVEVWESTDLAVKAPDLVALVPADPAGVRFVEVSPFHTLAPWDTGPSGAPVTASPVALARPHVHAEGSVTLAVLDTGRPATVSTFHPGNVVTYAIVQAEPYQPDPLYAGTVGNLDEVSAAGHGLFVASVATGRTPVEVVVSCYRTTKDFASDALRAAIERVFRSLGIPIPPKPGVLLSSDEIARDLKAVADAPFEPGQHLIVNMSFGGYVKAADIDVVKNAIEYLLAKHPTAVLCCAAGNKADLANGVPGTKHVYPAAYVTSFPHNIVSVGAIDATAGTIARFSGRGEWVNAWASGVGIVAEYVPGTWTNTVLGYANFPATNPYAAWSGTSFATPIVAAAIANECVATGKSPKDSWAALKASLPTGLTWFEGSVLHTEEGAIFP